LVLPDRELRKGIALGIVRLTAEPAPDVTLLADAVDVDVDRVVALCSTTDRGLGTLVDVEHDARHRVGELEEVAGELRHGLDVVQRDDLADLGGMGFDKARAADRHRLELVEIQKLGCGDAQRDGLLSARASVHAVSAGRQAHDRVGAVGAGLGPASQARLDVLGRDFGVGVGLALQGGAGLLRPHHAGPGRCGCDRRCDERCNQTPAASYLLLHVLPLIEIGASQRPQSPVTQCPLCAGLLARRPAARRPPGRRRAAEGARAPQEARTTSSAGMVSVDAGVASGALIAAASRSSARAPSSAILTRTVVSGGETKRAIGMSSTPASAISAGTRTCASLKAKRLPSAIMSLAANTASGH